MALNTEDDSVDLSEAGQFCSLNSKSNEKSRKAKNEKEAQAQQI